ncbi:TetR/AcrR family transcriptional regulator [Kitasatospora sp. NBC_00240]|uniref:TetR/AcrR family transcriptional regulator n=1 Tax=Kitasatospora sp. NBC_00240 TaxID=2903567 RepID=UPI00225B9267|nr:TetR/AcrR family transcriptional regulator [Kitasatospora sp. NBC_00240]MCX5212553.1 TetR/AcrR family transcriptional regulator [Kitasatospora sp. NBC_00240]
MATRSSTPDPARRSERSRKAVLAAAAELVTELGYAKVSIEAIAARAGVGKQTIYRWWPSKGAVVFDAFLAAEEDEGGSLAVPDTGDLAADLRSLLRPTVRQLADPVFNNPARALVAETQLDPALLREYRERLLAPLLEVTKERLRSARRTGGLPADADLDLAVELLYGPLYYRWIHHLGPLDDAYADSVVELFLRAFRS